MRRRDRAGCHGSDTGACAEEEGRHEQHRHAGDASCGGPWRGTCGRGPDREGEDGREELLRGFGNTRGAEGNLDDCAGKWDSENVADPPKVRGRKAGRSRHHGSGRTRASTGCACTSVGERLEAGPSVLSLSFLLDRGNEARRSYGGGANARRAGEHGVSNILSAGLCVARRNRRRTEVKPKGEGASRATRQRTNWRKRHGRDRLGNGDGGESEEGTNQAGGRSKKKVEGIGEEQKSQHLVTTADNDEKGENWDNERGGTRDRRNELGEQETTVVFDASDGKACAREKEREEGDALLGHGLRPAAIGHGKREKTVVAKRQRRRRTTRRNGSGEWRGHEMKRAECLWQTNGKERSRNDIGAGDRPGSRGAAVEQRCAREGFLLRRTAARRKVETRK
ncbi:hypothetical protein ERJ75_001724300 [Trypanosoma vivax]|nr:hypothetical protein ERJ75_001724300 [Trypanosoma vivax]